MINQINYDDMINVQIGKVFNIEATDEDIGSNSELIYSVVDTATFSVDENGVVNVKVNIFYIYWILKFLLEFDFLGA